MKLSGISFYKNFQLAESRDLEFPRWLSGKEPTCNAGDSGLISGSGIFLEEGNDNQLQYSYLGNPMDRGAWRATVHGEQKSWTLSN